MGVYNPWTRHYQAAWENRAANHGLPMWARVVCFAYGRHEANGHARFQRGQLTVLLGKPPEGDKPFRRAPRQTVHDAIATAVTYGWLDKESCMECLVVPGHAVADPRATPRHPAPCMNSARSVRAKPSLLN